MTEWINLGASSEPRRPQVRNLPGRLSADSGLDS